MQRIATALSTAPAAEDAAIEAVAAVKGPLDGEGPDLAYLFVSPAHLAEVEIAAALVREHLRPAHPLQLRTRPHPRHLPHQPRVPPPHHDRAP